MSGSVDVIELGSSDEEPEPATKKPKRLNAMVSIPNSTPGIKTPVSKGLIHTQRRSVQKVRVAPSVQNLINNPFANKHLEVNHQTIKAQTNNSTSKNSKKSTIVRNIVLPGIIDKTGGKNVVNPASFVTAADMASAKMILKSLQSTKPQPIHTSIPIKMAGNVGAKVMAMRPQINTVSMQIPAAGKTASKNMVVRSHKGLSGLSKNITIKSPAALKSTGPPQLPPGITVTRVTGPTKKRRSKRPASPAKVTFKKQKLDSVGAAEVPTVELDDDDEDIPQTPATASPQWYVRPEEIDNAITSESKEVEGPANPQPMTVEKTTEPESLIADKSKMLEQIPSMQVENDKEPEERERAMIEITIDDSPIKPPPIPQAKMVSDLAIIVEDSPKKPDEELKKSKNSEKKKKHGSNEKKEVRKSPHSKKKLNFPKNTPEFIEVEVDFLNPIDNPLETNIPNSDIINLDTPTKPIQESPESSSVKIKPSTAIKKNISGETSQPCEELNLALKSLGTKENSDRNKTIETNKPYIVEEIVNSKDIKTTTNAEIKKVYPESKTLEPANEVKCIEFEPTLDMEIPTVNISESNEVEPGKAGEAENVNAIDSKMIESEVHNSLQINKEIKPAPISKDRKVQCSGEFNQIYQEFIDLCFKIENSDDMTKIVEKKVKEYYRQVDKSFTESKDFIDIVSAKIVAIKLNPENLYLYIKDIVDELKIRRKQSKGKIEVQKNAAEVCADVSLSEGAEESDGADGASRNIRRLEKTIRKLHRAIHKLEEEEVDFDDDTESVYLLTESKDGNSSQAIDKPLEKDRQIQIERYKARFVRVHAKLLQLTGTRMPSEAKVRLEARPGRPAGPTRRLEQWINKRVPVGAPLPFPDFHDVVRCVREANAEDRLGWSEMEVMEEARDMFSRCGKKLQRRRQANEWRLASARISAATDPADASPELKHKLDDNKKLAAKRESDVINKYADRQNQLQLEAVEINENEADDSAPSSDDDVQYIEDISNVTNSNIIKTLSPHKEKVKSKSPEIAKKSLNKEEVQTKSPEMTINSLEKEKVHLKSLDTAINSPDKENVLAKSPEKSSISADKRPEIVSVEDLHPIDDNKTHIEFETCGDNGVSNKKAIELEDDSSQSNLQNDVATNKVFESEGEDIRLVLSDEDSNAEVKNIDSDGQSLLQKMSDVENITSTIESSDTDAPIAISETHESSDSHNGSIKSSDVVSIENSSSGTDIEVKPSSPSKEKQSLLEIDDSEEESGNQAKLSDNNTGNENDAVSYEKVLIGTTEEESNTCEEIQEIELTSMPRPDTRNAEEELNLCVPTNSEIISKTCGDPVPRNSAEKSKSDENDSCKIITPSDKMGEFYVEIGDHFNTHDSKPEEIVDECVLDTENSNSQSVDDNENHSSSENQNSDIPMDIGPTEIQGTISVDNENNSSSSDVPMDTRHTVFQGSLSIDDDENNSSSQNQNCDVPMDIGPTIIQGTLLVNDDENSCGDNQNIGMPLESCRGKDETTMSNSEPAPEAIEDNQNNVIPLEACRGEDETTTSDSETAPETVGDNQNIVMPVEFGRGEDETTMSDSEKVPETVEDNQNIVMPLKACRDEDETTMSDSEPAPETIEDNQNNVIPLEACRGENETTTSDSETAPETVGDNQNIVMPVEFGRGEDETTMPDSEKVPEIVEDNQKIVMPLEACRGEDETTMSDSEPALETIEDNQNNVIPLEACRGEDETTTSDSETAPETVETTSTNSRSVEILSDTDQYLETVKGNKATNVEVISHSQTDTLTLGNSNSSVTSTETITHRTMDIVSSEIDSIKVQNARETSSSISLIAPPQLNIALAGD